MDLEPLKERRRGCRIKPKSHLLQLRCLKAETCGVTGDSGTYRFIDLLVEAALADQAELVLGILLLVRSGAGGSVHQRAGACMWPGQTLRGSPAKAWRFGGAARLARGLVEELQSGQLKHRYSTIQDTRVR